MSAGETQGTEVDGECCSLIASTELCQEDGDRLRVAWLEMLAMTGMTTRGQISANMYHGFSACRRESVKEEQKF